MSLRHSCTWVIRTTASGRVSLGRLLYQLMGILVACGAAFLTACSAPDYSAVRDWAGAASRTADYPTIVTSCFYRSDGSVSPTPLWGDGTLAMQDALSIYLSALSTIAADGVLEYQVDPFVQLTGRAGAASEAGGLAVGTLGGLLYRTTRRNARAPQLGETTAVADESVQALIAALRMALRDAGLHVAGERNVVAAGYIQLEYATKDPVSRQMLRELAAMRDREYAAGKAARTNYDLVLASIAEGHALLKTRNARLSQAETARDIRAAEDALRRAADLLPRAMAPMPAGVACPTQLPSGIILPPPVQPPTLSMLVRVSPAGS